MFDLGPQRSTHSFTLPNGTTVKTCPAALGMAYINYNYCSPPVNLVFVKDTPLLEEQRSSEPLLSFVLLNLCPFCNSDGPGAFDFVQGDNATRPQ